MEHWIAKADHKTFIQVARKVAYALFINAGEKQESNLGNRVEFIFDISFWVRCHQLGMVGF